jgi:hypothetical protein
MFFLPQQRARARYGENLVDCGRLYSDLEALRNIRISLINRCKSEYLNQINTVETDTESSRSEKVSKKKKKKNLPLFKNVCFVIVEKANESRNPQIRAKVSGD